MKKLIVLGMMLVACSGGEPAQEGAAPADSSVDAAVLAQQAPPPVSAAWRPLVGEYVSDTDTVSILERHGVLQFLPWGGEAHDLTTGPSGFATDGGLPVAFWPEMDGGDSLAIGGRSYTRLTLGASDGGTFRITPLRGPEELRAEALAAEPPAEEGDFLPTELVELTALDSTIALDIRYAGTDNFMGEVFYSQPRAFLQRPAAEALVRAHRQLTPRGYGLLIHDGYRPWYVTKMFWEATPEELRAFVADPATGSRHNRGCAVDLTLYDLATGEPVEMTGGYDEFSPRSFADYPGGTSRQRWHRELLRSVMEAEGFTVYDAEWWHFDHRDWARYRIGNQRFEELGLD